MIHKDGLTLNLKRMLGVAALEKEGVKSGCVRFGRQANGVQAPGGVRFAFHWPFGLRIGPVS